MWPFSTFLLYSWLGLNRTCKDNQRSFYEEASKDRWDLEGNSWTCLWHHWKERRGVPEAFLASLYSPLFSFSLPSSELGECVLLVQSHCIMGGLQRARGCDIIKPICERPSNHTYACMCVWCHSVAPAPFIFVWPQARKTEFWHQRPQASAHAPGTKVSLILPLSSPPFSLSLSPWLSAHRLHTNPFFTGPYCVSGSSNYKPRLASFISLRPALLYNWFKDSSIHLLRP